METMSAVEEADYVDTFMDASHLKESFPRMAVKMEVDGQLLDLTEVSNDGLSGPPYRLKIKKEASEIKLNQQQSPLTTKRKKGDSKKKLVEQAVSEQSSVISLETVVLATPYQPLSYGPFLDEEVKGSQGSDPQKRNSIRFTPSQIEAIRSGISPGLTMIIGPPGTGKTDVAVQIIKNLYCTYPQQKILLITHSNAALNDLFTKIMSSSSQIDRSHLLRLGSGEQLLREGRSEDSTEQFSRIGRVNGSLTNRMELLGSVQRLAVSLGSPGDVGYSCETASYYYAEHVQPRIRRFLCAAEANDNAGESISSLFPFQLFFQSQAPDREMFNGEAVFLLLRLYR
jgi:intron-binding protein aquarius